MEGKSQAADKVAAKVEMVDITQLEKAEYNPRALKENQYKDLKTSIEKFGMVQPLVVNSHKKRSNVIIGGHQRYIICNELGISKVPVIWVKLNEKEEKDLNIRLNKNTGEFDFDALANYFDTDELLEWGFQGWELGFTKQEMEIQDIPDDNEASWDDNTPKISYTIIFNDEDEQAIWFEFMRVLKNKYMNVNTLAERLVKHIGEQDADI